MRWTLVSFCVAVIGSNLVYVPSLAEQESVLPTSAQKTGETDNIPGKVSFTKNLPRKGAKSDLNHDGKGLSKTATWKNEKVSGSGNEYRESETSKTPLANEATLSSEQQNDSGEDSEVPTRRRVYRPHFHGRGHAESSYRMRPRMKYAHDSYGDQGCLCYNPYDDHYGSAYEDDVVYRDNNYEESSRYAAETRGLRDGWYRETYPSPSDEYFELEEENAWSSNNMPRHYLVYANRRQNGYSNNLRSHGEPHSSSGKLKTFNAGAQSGNSELNSGGAKSESGTLGTTSAGHSKTKSGRSTSAQSQQSGLGSSNAATTKGQTKAAADASESSSGQSSSSSTASTWTVTMEEWKSWQTMMTKMQTEISTLREEFKNISLQKAFLPVGFTYVQMANTTEPSKLWSQLVWKDITSSYAGVFFRAWGGDSAAFGVTQTGNAPGLVTVSTQIGTCFNFESSIAVPPSGISPWIRSGDDVQGGCEKRVNMNFGMSSGEVRPVNQAIRIWQVVSH